MAGGALALEDIAQRNLQKTRDRWGAQSVSVRNFDADFSESESLPRQFEIELREVNIKGKVKIRVILNGKN